MAAYMALWECDFTDYHKGKTAMKLQLLLNSAAIAIAAISVPQIAGAAVDATLLQSIAPPAWAVRTQTDDNTFQLAKSGSGRDGDGGRGRDDDDDDDDDDHIGGSNDDGEDHQSGGHNNGASSTGNSAGDVSGSNRRRPRIPGGSGCDDAGDIAEHPECSR